MYDALVVFLHRVETIWRSLRGLAIAHPLRTFAVVAFCLAFVFWVYFHMLSSVYTEVAERGQFGDMFGALNAFVSGLAFIGLVIAILLQQQQMKEGRHFAKMAQIPFVTLCRPNMWCGILQDTDPKRGGVKIQCRFNNATEYPALDMIVIIRVKNSDGTMGDIAKYYVSAVTKGCENSYDTKVNMEFENFRIWVSLLKNSGSVFEIVYLYRSLLDVGVLRKEHYSLRFNDFPVGYLECLSNGKSYEDVYAILKQNNWQLLRVDFDIMLNSSEHRLLSIDKFLKISCKYRPSLMKLDDPNIV